MAWTHDQMAQRAGKELQDASYVNMGIGLPTKEAKHNPSGVDVRVKAA